MKKILFRVDGERTIGYGHFYRCLAIAERIPKEVPVIFLTKNKQELLDILKNNNNRNVEVIQLDTVTLFAENKLFNDLYQCVDLVVVDSYKVQQEYFLMLKDIGYETVYLDDLLVDFKGIDHIINHNQRALPSDYSKRTQRETTLHLGFEYLLLRKEILEQVALPIHEKERGTVFLAAGGTDSANVLPSIIKSILLLRDVSELHVLSTNKLEEFKHNPRIKWHSNLDTKGLISLLQLCSVAVTSASSLSLECCCVGTELITFHVAENQVSLDSFLSREGLAISLGRWGEDSEKELVSVLINVFEGEDFLSNKQKEYFEQFNFSKLENIFI